MGHKLTAVFGHEVPRMILTAGVINNNKIPFRPQLDREAANSVMPYHTTLFQWDKEQDIFYLNKMADLPGQLLVPVFISVCNDKKTFNAHRSYRII